MPKSSCELLLQKGDQVILEQSKLLANESPEKVFTVISDGMNYPNPCYVDLLGSEVIDQTTGMPIERKVRIASKDPKIERKLE
jgi:hypothetical protein